MYRLPAFLLLLVGAISPARAETVRVRADGVSLQLVLPAGHCRMDRKQPADKLAMDAVERITRDSNRVLLMFAECGQLKSYREGSLNSLEEFGQYMMPRRDQRTKLPPAEVARQMTEFLKSKGAEVIGGAESTTRERLETMRLGNLADTRQIGVMRTDERAAYLGIIMGVKPANADLRYLVGITALGAVKQRIVTLNLYGRFHEGPIGAEKVVKTLEKSTQTYTATAMANEESSRRQRRR